jgi:hypothetical protein
VVSPQWDGAVMNMSGYDATPVEIPETVEAPAFLKDVKIVTIL